PLIITPSATGVSTPTATIESQKPTPAPPKKDAANGASSTEKAPESGSDTAAPKPSDSEKPGLVPVPTPNLLK
ncbi:MAG: hypothetical protein ABSA77_09900, partial [Thermoguttaceae bacterium]